MNRVTAFVALLLVPVRGFTIAPLVGRTCPAPPRWHMVDETNLAENDVDFDEMDVDDVLDLLEAGGDLEMLLEDATLPQDESAAEQSFEDAEVMAKFLTMLDETPPGTMENEDIGSLRNVMQQLVQNQEETNTAETVQQVEKTLFRLLDEYDEAAQTRDKQRMEILRPEAYDFVMVMQAWLDSDSKEAKDNVVALFFQQEELFAQTGLCRPTLEVVETVLHALAESRTRDADRKAWSIVERLDDYQLVTTVPIYHSLITCLARSRQKGSAQRAEKCLIDVAAKFPPSLDSNGNKIGITVDSFNVVLTSWAKSELEDGPDRAGKLLMIMEEVDQQQGILKPTASSFTSLIDAYAQMNTWEAACQAERTMNALLNHYLLEDKDPTLEPNIATWGIVLACWLRVSKKGSADAASNAGKLLTRLETLYADGKLSYGPDAIAYVTVLNAWCKCKALDKEPGKHAEELLEEMNERYIDGDDSYKPSAKSVLGVVEAWVKSDRQEALFKADEIFERYEDMGYLSDPKDEGIVNDILKSLIFGWSMKEDPECAHEYLVDMVDQGFQPDSFCFDKVIEAYTVEGGRFKEIQEVFALLEKCSEAGEVKPNERVYTSFIRALTKTKVPELAKEAFAVLERMNSLALDNKGIKPTVFTYNAVLKACATALSEDAVSNLEAFKVSLSVFNELRADETKEQPDHVTFGNVLQCAALLPQGPQREGMISSTFRLCCRSGFVNTFVIRDLQLAATEELWRELCECPQGDVDVERLPQEWVKRFEKSENSRKPPGNQRPGGNQRSGNQRSGNERSGNQRSGSQRKY